eukprot:4398724-Pyramimonas_sp.AAC.1
MGGSGHRGWIAKREIRVLAFGAQETAVHANGCQSERRLLQDLAGSGVRCPGLGCRILQDLATSDWP